MTAAHLDGAPIERRSGLMVAVLAFCGIVVSLMQTLVVPLIPELPRLFDTSASNASWIITATLLAAAVSNPVVGRLGDMYGKRRVLLIILALLVIGSVICALSSALPLIVAGRALQGCAIGVIPLGISIMRDELPRERLGSAIALMSATLGVGGAVGLPLAAFIAEHANWHALFWVSGGIGLLDIVLVALLVRESPVRSGGRFDLPGAVGLTAGLIALLLAITKGGDWGWGSASTIGLFATSVVILIAWGLFQLRRSDPLVDLRTSARRPVLLTNIASIVVGFAMMVMMLVLPVLLQSPKTTGYGLGLTMVQAGLCLAPGGLVSILLAPVSAWISRMWGPKVSLMIGAGVMGVTYAVGVGFTDGVVQVTIVSTAVGAGLALAYAAMPALIMNVVPITETAAANGLNALMRSVGTSTSSAVTSAILANMTMTLGIVTLPSLRGLQTALAVGAGAAIAGVLIAAFIPGRPKTRPSVRRSPAGAPARSVV